MANVLTISPALATEGALIAEKTAARAAARRERLEGLTAGLDLRREPPEEKPVPPRDGLLRPVLLPHRRHFAQWRPYRHLRVLQLSKPDLSAEVRGPDELDGESLGL